jgi:hypothetical protein
MPYIVGVPTIVFRTVRDTMLAGEANRNLRGMNAEWCAAGKKANGTERRNSYRKAG